MEYGVPSCTALRFSECRSGGCAQDG
jgi:hypothetical protein